VTTERSKSKRPWFHLVLPAALLFLRCGGEPDTPEVGGKPVPVEVQTAREIAAALFADDSLEESREALAPLLDRASVDAEDLLRAAVVELALDDEDQALALLKQAENRSENSARYHYLMGVLARREGDLEGAVARFRRAHELAENDIPTHVMLAVALGEMGDPEAAEHLRRIVEIGPMFAGSWHVTAVYRLGRLLMQAGELEQAQEMLHEHSLLLARGITGVSDADIEKGTFGRLEFPAPSPGPRIEPPTPPRLREVALLTELAGFKSLQVLDLKAEWRVEREGTEVLSSEIGTVDLVAHGPDGLVALIAGSDGGWETRRLYQGPVAAYRGFDLGQDGDLDFWVVTGERLLLLVAEDGSLVPASHPLPELPAAPLDLEVVDYDHEGDLDLLLVGSFGVRLWRNDGADVDGSFNDATSESGLAASGAYAWCLVEDLDTDQDVDLLAGGAERVLLADNRRGERFEDESGRLPPEVATDIEPIVADLDGDSRPDIWPKNGQGVLWLGSPSGEYRSGVAAQSGSAPSAGGVLTDVNLDGEYDLVLGEASGSASTLLSVGSPFQKVVSLLQAPSTVSAAIVGLAPSSGHQFELTLASDRGVAIYRGDASAPQGVRLVLRGAKDNRRGVGAIVEIRAGANYQRIYWQGEPRLIGLGSETQADWIRVTWPNGVVQTEMGLPAGADRVIEQVEGLVGSCPFLYAWNGKTFGFVTDVLGITPLGLPMSRDQMVPPDHDEFVLIRGDQLVERDGFYELQITEELREVTYLDAARLDVVDHPKEAEVYPNERFTFPPFPKTHIHTVSRGLLPRRAMGSDGRDWTAEVGGRDLFFAAPFTPYRTRLESGEYRGQFLGLAPPHWLQLEFDPAELTSAATLRLIMTGWFYWTDSSVNMAVSRTPGISFVPPILQVPDGEGAWRDAGPPVGFPAGKVKTMVIDVSEILDRSDPRLRLFSTLRLYWDSIRLAIDDDAAPLKVTPLPVRTARLWERGFSAPYEIPGDLGLVWFDWDRLSPQPRWNQHPGLYTRLGQVGELLTEIDDRFVVLGAGDALTLRFDATQAPALPQGWKRDYLLFLDGWAKDRDPNARLAEMVEPLPFHGMSGYPYRPEESFPDDQRHIQWRIEWQTRPARRWIEPLHRERHRR